ncbi:MFS transporter [Sneathiella chungangensis]|uniref:MFS transporter n=1 Tax=Sneathiella chungangensis TaxID=1418234 RepID=A0A845MGR9_9PROT|nr:MFS transporter [Sneathiella chungangensis]MZR22881.1 MFS transporter [Sneathiella chungangensis]
MTAKSSQSKAKYVGLVGAVWISAFLVSLDYSAVTLALPTIAVHFHAGTSMVSWVSISYMLVTISLMLLAGPFIRRIGYRRALFIGLSLFTIGAIAAGFASSLLIFILMRVFIGLSRASIPGSAVLLSLFAAVCEAGAKAAPRPASPTS